MRKPITDVSEKNSINYTFYFSDTSVIGFLMAFSRWCNLLLDLDDSCAQHGVPGQYLAGMWQFFSIERKQKRKRQVERHAVRAVFSSRSRKTPTRQPGTDPMHLQLEAESEEEAGRNRAKRLEMQQELEKLKTLSSSSDSEKTALSAQVASLEE